MKNFILSLFEKMENVLMIQAIRNGLVMEIPILMIGSMVRILETLPIPLYQTMIHQFYHGIFIDVFAFMDNVTFGLLSVYMVIFISLCYAKICPKPIYLYGPPITAIACFATLSGFLNEGFDLTSFGVKGMFTAILTAIIVSKLYYYISVNRKFSLKKYTVGIDANFNQSASAIFPAFLILSLFALSNFVIVEFLHFSNVTELFVYGVNQIFHNMGRSILSGMLFVFLSSIMWFFGIHGSDVLDSVSQHLFVPATDVNANLIAIGNAPTEIFSKTFFDVFVLMGGCGCTLSLLIGLLLFSKSRSNRNLSKLAVIPMCFNINELMVFGLPIIFNPYFFIPFLLTPLVLIITSVTAMQFGLVPLATASVEWTTPVLIGGYLATGSVAGSLLQLFNLIVGALIYRPFILLYDREKNKSAGKQMKSLVEMMQRSEENNIPIRLTEARDSLGLFAKMLAIDLKHAINTKQIQIYYQPQFDHQNHCIGAEALLRWKHEIYGMVYPPLVIQLAEETETLGALERYVVETVADKVPQIKKIQGENFKICINVTVKTLYEDSFKEFLNRLFTDGALKKGDICIEITEQMAMQFDEETEKKFNLIRSMGVLMAIDDFSMGHTSLKYLQNNQFDLVKLDRMLVENLKENPRCQDIIASIIYLAQSLGFDVLAEFVETEEQKSMLEQIGCLQYQGYLYSPAIAYEEFLAFIQTEK